MQSQNTQARPYVGTAPHGATCAQIAGSYSCIHVPWSTAQFEGILPVAQCMQCSLLEPKFEAHHEAVVLCHELHPPAARLLTVGFGETCSQNLQVESVLMQLCKFLWHADKLFLNPAPANVFEPSPRKRVARNIEAAVNTSCDISRPFADGSFVRKRLPYHAGLFLSLDIVFAIVGSTKGYQGNP